MKSKLSLKDTNSTEDSRLSNADKIIKALAESGKMNKWDLHKKTLLHNSRVYETVSVLEKEGYIQIAGEKKVKNRLPSKKYGLTFKGALAYLTSTDLEHPRTMGEPNEPIEEFKKQYIEGYRTYLKKLNHLTNILKTFGEDLGFEIFKQIDWLKDNYGLFLFDIVLESAKNQKIDQPNFFNASREQRELEKKRLIQTIEKIRETPSLQKLVVFRNDGKGNEATSEINVLRDEESRLEQLKNFVDLSIVNENKYWKKSFAYNFFENLSHMSKKDGNKNEPLARLAKELLEGRRIALIPMEKIVKKLEGK